jgi:hypothetical protein
MRGKTQLLARCGNLLDTCRCGSVLASIKTNDENMLVIKNDTRVADIYLGEFMRLHTHYAFRQAVAIFLEQNPEKTPEDFRQRFLIEGRTDWTKSYFDRTDRRAGYARRVYFAVI